MEGLALMAHQRHSSGTIWEDIVGYSRAVRAGDHVYITGTIGADANGNLIGVDDPFAQTIAALEKVERALTELGTARSDVVRTRLFVTDLDQWEEIARAHKQFFGDIRPATTMVEVSRLFADALIEIEADAVLDNH